MDSRMPASEAPTADAAEFVRFCYRRRRVAWPDLYDEMCAVGSRGLFRGWGIAELAEHGIGFSLFSMPALAALVAEVIAEERANAPKPSGFSIGRLAATRPSAIAGGPVDGADGVPAGRSGSDGGRDREGFDREPQADFRPSFAPLAAR